MGPIQRIRRWWQIRSGCEDTPLDGDTPAWVISLMVHLAVLFVLTWLTLWEIDDRSLLTLDTSAHPDEIAPEEFHFSPEASAEIGALARHGASSPAPQALVDRQLTEVTTELDPLSEVGEFAIVASQDPIALGPETPDRLVVQGVGTVGTTGTSGAIDRITHEILLSLEQRPTLVVWLFDRSGSLRRQRTELASRLDRIYEELGAIAAAGNEAFRKHQGKPLLSSVMSFGQHVELMTPKPTEHVEEIRAAVQSIQDDPSGVENVFQAVHQAADRFRRLRSSPTSRRNVMLIVLTDEAGDDVRKLDHAVDFCRRLEMPVYVVGVPAPFGRELAYVKYVDPDPNFDQSPQWAPVHQGPESLMPERLKLHITGAGQRDEPIDSGFGPYALTRLCYETGGIYFAVHPNRQSRRRVSRGETAEMSSYLTQFFDSARMNRYRPEYVSVDSYRRLLQENKARAALVEASKLSWMAPMEGVRRAFPKRSDADLVNLLTVAQRDAARVQPSIRRICELLRIGEVDRSKLTQPRWQAGFDLAAGQALAVKVRTEGYNAMLAKAKSMKFKDPTSDTWVLDPSEEIATGSTHAKEAERAKVYLTRTVKQHPGTPWAFLAQQELRVPLGWKWTELRQQVERPRQRQAGNGGAPMPRDDQRRMLTRPKPRRAPPKL